MKRSVAIYAGLLVLSLGAAWVKWTAEPEPELDGKVVMLQGEAEDIEKIEWKTENDEALLEMRSDALGAFTWVTYTRYDIVEGGHDEDGGHAEDDGHGHGGPDKPDVNPDGVPEGPAAPGEEAEGEDAPAEGAEGAESSEEDGAEGAEVPEEVEPDTPPERTATVTHFKAGENGEKLLTSLSPLIALRKLDAIPDDKRETVGLDDPQDSLVITRKGRTATLELGGEVYGTRDRYVRHVESGDVYLVDDEVLRPLKYARTRLPDRTLFAVAKADIVSLSILAPSGTALEVDQQNAQDASKAAFVRASAPDEADEQLQTWMDKALKLKGSKYADPDDLPAELEARFSITFNGKDDSTDTFEVLQAGEDGDWYGRSGHTRGLMKLLSGPTSALADDVESLVTE